MKCIYCSRDSKYVERRGGKCPECGHAFAFEPKRGDRLTDPAFNMAIERVSSAGSVKWTKRHLYYEIARAMRRKNRMLPWVLGGLAIMCLVFVWWEPAVLVVSGTLALFAYLKRPTKTPELRDGDFDVMWGRWVEAHGLPKGSIVRKAPSESPKARALPADIHHYSFDRAVITDTPDTVDLLLANNFHFENNCAVLTANGYPAEAFEIVRGMLKQNPKLLVYVVHDATLEGCTLSQTLKSEGWFQEGARIVDVGLRPEHARRFKGLWQPPAYSSVTSSALGSSDLKWLSQNSVELAVIRPEQVIKRLFRAMSGLAELPSATGDSLYVDSTSFGTDASASDGGGDSFG